MVATEQQAVFFQHQAQVVGRVAGGVEHAQGMGVFGVLQDQAFAIGQFAVGGELAGSPGRGCRGQTQDGRAVSAGFAQGLQHGCARRMVGMRMGADDHVDVAACRVPELLHMGHVGWAGVDHNVAAVVVAHQVAVGAGAGHHAGVGRGQALHVAQQRDGVLGLPVQGVCGLSVRAGQGEFAKRRVVRQIVRFSPRQPTGARGEGSAGEGLTCRIRRRVEQLCGADHDPL